ncbi:beta-glucosidase 24-like, partial [Malus sylvestris]|uniref:beta-glucosidase 24-like n=1 Tax=Malus sylvestris TaxID=3752 RepID=UPI0021ACBCEA
MIKLGFILLLVLGCAVTTSKSAKQNHPKDYASCDAHHIFNRSSFSSDFIFGSAGAAYQFEGAAKEGGRGPCVWDTFTHKYPGIKPFVTLFHWDFPQALEDEYLGFLSPNSVSDFRDFADLCFKEFGDKIKHWITLNEPQTYSVQGYTVGAFAPGRCSNHTKCKEGGNSATEPYLSAHHQLLAHAAAVNVYRDKYQATQKGVIGITLNSGWSVPFSNSTEDKDAAVRALDFSYGWFMDPVTSGRYPKSMQRLIGNRLPNFTKEQSKMLKGSYDFVGLNYYSSSYAKDVTANKSVKQPSQSTDSNVESLNNRNGVPIGPMAASDWLYIYPQGLQELLTYTKIKYKNPIIYITENGSYGS